MRTERVVLTVLLAFLLAGAPVAAHPAEAQAESAPQAQGPRAESPATPEIVVGPGEEIRTITRALEIAEPGATIRVLPGSYREGTIEISRSVRLVGEDFPEIDGESGATVLLVTADDVEITGLLVRRSGVSHIRDHAAIHFEDVRGCLVRGNRLEENFFGIYLARTKGCTLTGNTITATGLREVTSGNGIHLWNSERVVIRDNRIRGHRDGIYLEHVREVELHGNHSEANLRYGLHFMFSDETVCAGNTFRDNSAGVAVMYSRGVRMVDNVFADNWGPAAYGLLIKEINDSEIRGNTFRGNTVGVYSEGSGRIRVEGNRFLANGWAVKIMANSQDNVFTGNDFIDNSFDVTTNSRRNVNTFDANHWSRYQGYDLVGDGFGDVPYRPVRLFSLVVEKNPVALILLRSLFIDLLDLAERVAPILTPEALMDERPVMRPMVQS